MANPMGLTHVGKTILKGLRDDLPDDQRIDIDLNDLSGSQARVVAAVKKVFANIKTNTRTDDRSRLQSDLENTNPPKTVFLGLQGGVGEAENPLRLPRARKSDSKRIYDAVTGELKQGQWPPSNRKYVNKRAEDALQILGAYSEEGVSIQEATGMTKLTSRGQCNVFTQVQSAINHQSSNWYIAHLPHDSRMTYRHRDDFEEEDRFRIFDLRELVKLNKEQEQFHSQVLSFVDAENNNHWYRPSMRATYSGILRLLSLYENSPYWLQCDWIRQVSPLSKLHLDEKQVAAAMDKIKRELADNKKGVTLAQWGKDESPNVAFKLKTTST